MAILPYDLRYPVSKVRNVSKVNNAVMMMIMIDCLTTFPVCTTRTEDLLRIKFDLCRLILPQSFLVQQPQRKRVLARELPIMLR